MDKLNDRKLELTKTIEAIDGLLANKHWQTLKELVFDGLVERLNRQLLSEAQSPKIDEDKLYHLQGQRQWAVRYSNLAEYAEMLKKELEGINKQLK